jgi:hypothetical protein
MQDTFRIGIFTSASSRTVETVVPMLENAAGSNGRPLLAEKDFILTRSHTVAAPSSHIKEGGNTWDTVKPLNQWFKDLSRIILVDDDAYKVRSLGYMTHLTSSSCYLLHFLLPAEDC